MFYASVKLLMWLFIYLFVVYLTTLWIAQAMQIRMTQRSMNSELEGTWKEAFVDQFCYYLDICLQGVRNTTKELSHDSRFTDRDLNIGP
jgi:hypothetical protein